MDEIGLESGTLDSALTALLHRFPEAVLVALDDSSLRVPVPDSGRFRGFTSLPGDQSTIVDVVVPDDRMQVVTTWERAQSSGIAQGQVRALSNPAQALRLTFVDARERHGVWIGVLAAEGQWQPTDGAGGQGVLVLAPRRPRTAVMHKDMYAVITEVDDQASAMLGWSRSELVGHRSLEFMHPDDHERAIAQWLEMRARRESQRVRVRHSHRDGSWLWVEIENRFLGMADPGGSVAAAHLTDISDEMAAYELVRQQERLFRRVAESLPLGLFVVTPDRKVAYANTRLGALLGVAQASTLDEQLATIDPADRAALGQVFAATLDGGNYQETEVGFRLPRSRGARRCLITVASLSQEEGQPGAIVSVTDVTDSTRIREELTHRATYDVLTGCHNRASAMAILDRALAQGDQPTVVVFIDLDKFKPVNDIHGHAVGDALLVQVAHRLCSVLRGQDIVARLGGDEFLLICPGTEDPALALAIGHRVRDKLRDPIQAAGHTLELTASIGVAISTPGTTSDQLVANADAAMYESKRRGDGTPVPFTQESRRVCTALLRQDGGEGHSPPGTAVGLVDT